MTFNILLGIAARGPRLDDAHPIRVYAATRWPRRSSERHATDICGTLHLRLFGVLSLSRHGGAEDVAAAAHGFAISGRPGSLLAYLALGRGRFFTRAELIAALWGEAESGGTGSFSTTLWRLRKAIERPPLNAGAVIACDRRGAVGMPEDPRLVVDVDEFEQLVAPALAKPIERLEPGDVECLRNGVARYRDDVLAGFADEWALREREKLRRHQLNALGRLMQVCTVARDYDGAIRYAQDILDRDQLREDVHRELMRLLIASGQRALALKQFELCRAALKRELAIQPMRETMALYQQVADVAVGHDLAPMPSAPPPDAVHVVLPSPSSERGARDLVAAARRYLQLADEQLQLIPPFVP